MPDWTNKIFRDEAKLNPRSHLIDCTERDRIASLEEQVKELRIEVKLLKQVVIGDNK